MTDTVVLNDHAILFSRKEAWLDFKKKTIGSSDAPGVVGMSRYESMLSIWARKSKPITDLDLQDNKFTEAGRMLEPVILKWFRKRIAGGSSPCVMHTGADTILELVHLSDGAHREFCDFINGVPYGDVNFTIHAPASANDSNGDKRIFRVSATPDATIYIPRDTADARSVEEGTWIVEAKNTSAYKAGDWDGKVPPEVYVQVQHQLLVADLIERPRPVKLKGAFVVVLIGGNDLRWYAIERDPDMQAQMLEAYAEFARYEAINECPPPQTEDDIKYINSLTGVDDVTHQSVMLGAYGAEIHERLVDAEKVIKSYKAVVTDCRAKLIEMLGTNTVGVLPDGSSYTYFVTKRDGYLKEVPPWRGRILRHSNKKRND